MPSTSGIASPNLPIAGSGRPQTVMSSVALVSCLWGLLHSASAFAQEPAHTIERQQDERPGGVAANVQERFLRVEPKYVFLAHVGNKVTQNGKVLDTGFSFLIPDSAVTGSKEAVAHLSRARTAQWAAFACFMTAVGLFVGEEIVRQQNDDRWTRPSVAMAFGGALTLLTAFPFAHWRDWETFAAVNSYNHDLVTGQLVP
jgi:hypothetical protein